MILIELIENQRMLTKYTHSQRLVKTDTGERGRRKEKKRKPKENQKQKDERKTRGREKEERGNRKEKINRKEQKDAGV